MSNWDTEEVYLWISDNEGFKNEMEAHIGNELEFMTYLFVIVTELIERGNEIDITKVNGNEIYVDFSILVGNEQRGWCRNE